MAHLSVNGARRAHPSLVSQEGAHLVDASLLGNGVGDADTAIVGLCLCWWNAKE